MSMIVRRTQRGERPATIRPTLKESIDGIPYEIRTFRQAKRMTLKVSHDGRVWVSMPPRAAVRDARDFVRHNLEHIHQAIQRSQERTASRLQERARMPFRLPVGGVWFGVEIHEGDRHECRLDLVSQRVVLTVPASQACDEEQCRQQAFRYWRYVMISRANKELPARTIELARSVGERISRVSIRDQKTLWGSCSAARRSISLNWRCVLFPDFVRDYLIFHELAHLRHQNHSPKYWQWVETLCPNYREAEAWISQHGRALMEATASVQALSEPATENPTAENSILQSRRGSANTGLADMTQSLF